MGVLNKNQNFRMAAASSFSWRLFDDAACRRWVLETLHPHGARCPACDTLTADTPTIRNFWAGRRCVCKFCGRKFMALSGTFLQGAQISFAQVFLIVALIEMDAGIPVPTIAAAAGVSDDTVRAWEKKFKDLGE